MDQGEVHTPSNNRGNVKLALQQLIAALHLPSTTEQYRVVIQILKDNPQLMAAFIKQRQISLARRHQISQSSIVNPGGSTIVAENSSQQPILSLDATDQLIEQLKDQLQDQLKLDE